jgi:hypothetical protein
MRAHDGGAAQAGLQRCDAVSPSKQSMILQRIIVSVYSQSNHELLDLEDKALQSLRLLLHTWPTA